MNQRQAQRGNFGYPKTLTPFWKDFLTFAKSGNFAKSGQTTAASLSYRHLEEIGRLFIDTADLLLPTSQPFWAGALV